MFNRRHNALFSLIARKTSTVFQATGGPCTTSPKAIADSFILFSKSCFSIRISAPYQSFNTSAGSIEEKRTSSLLSAGSVLPAVFSRLARRSKPKKHRVKACLKRRRRVFPPPLGLNLKDLHYKLRAFCSRSPDRQFRQLSGQNISGTP